MDTEHEVEMLAVGEETHGFQAEAEEGILEEEWDNVQEEGAIHQLIYLHAMCAGCVAIWPVTVPKAHQPLEEVVPPPVYISPDSCNEAHQVIGVEDGVLDSAG